MYIVVTKWDFTYYNLLSKAIKYAKLCDGYVVHLLKCHEGSCSTWIYFEP